MRLYDIETPEQIRNLSEEQLSTVADDIRDFIIQTIAQKGGYLADNLSVVDAMVALHFVFQTPQDQLLIDGGHQCLAHKILTGRSPTFSTYRQANGLKTYCSCDESTYDTWNSMPIGSSLAVAFGLACARDKAKETYQIIDFIDSKGIITGSSLEALYQIGYAQHGMVIIFNEMIQTKTKSNRIIETLSSFRSSKAYRKAKESVNDTLRSNRIGNSVASAFESVKDHIKDNLLNDNLFQNMGFDYLGPIDGHDMHALINAFQAAKASSRPIVVHIQTHPSYGYPYAQDQNGWQEVMPFHQDTGKSKLLVSKDQCSWETWIDNCITVLQKQNPKLSKIDPSLSSRPKLALGMAAGIAKKGYHPFVQIQAKDIGQCIDTIQAHLANMKSPIIVGVNNAGIADGKGDIQQGIYDIRLLSSIPDIMISQPKDSQEALDLLYTASQTQNPFFIRYPFGIVSKPSEQIGHLLPIGSWSQFQIGLDPKCIVITYGQEFDRIVSKAKENQWDMIVINARFFKPVDEKILKQMFLMQLPIYIFEPDAKGSLSALVMQVYTKIMKPVHVLGIENHFVQQGSVRSIRIHEHISVNALFKEIDHEQHAVR